MLCRVDTAANHLDQVRAHCPNARTMFVTVDLHFVRLQREAAITRDEETSARAAETTYAELEIVDKADLTIAISDTETQLLRRLRPTARIHQLPIVRPIPGRRRPYGARADIAFIGGYRHPPNVDAVFYFLDHIWPRVRARLPGVCFQIVGADAPASIRSLSRDGVVFRGYVAELGDALDNVRLTVAPLRYGAGQKGKIVSSLSYGVPVVATSVAVEGMRIDDGVQALVRDDPDAFADAIVEAYESARVWTHLSDEGLALVERDFSFERGRAMLEEALAMLSLPAAHGQALSTADAPA
jgi:hypothetical protein